MAKEHKVCVMLRGGKFYNITPVVLDGETEELAAHRVLKDIYDAIKADKKTYQLLNSADLLNSFFVLSEITNAYVGTIDTEQEKRDKEDKRIHRELLKHQLRQYKNINSGEKWKQDNDDEDEKENGEF